ncbi:MAG: hypothetical protein KAG53_07890 [Endozoicomonadaceae bacterium]|nr:hypothetical protein [Endozoicomonadaceae bacterium]
MNVNNNCLPSLVSADQPNNCAEHNNSDLIETKAILSMLRAIEGSKPNTGIRERTIESNSNINSYEDKPTRTSEDIYTQLKTKGYSAWEDDFTNIALGIDDDEIKSIDDFLSLSHNKVRKIKGLHGEMSSFKMLALINRGTATSWQYMENKVYPDNMMKIANKIINNITDTLIKDQTGNMRILLVGIKNDSLYQEGVGFHQDFCEDISNPKFIIHCVFGSKSDDDEEERKISNLTLAHACTFHLDKYINTERLSHICRTILYDRNSVRDMEILHHASNIPIHIISIKNTIGSGFIVNQRHRENKFEFIAHATEPNNNSATRSSLIARIYVDGDSFDPCKLCELDKIH